MLNPYTLNIQESLKHAWHCDFFFEVLGSESVYMDSSKSVFRVSDKLHSNQPAQPQRLDRKLKFRSYQV